MESSKEIARKLLRPYLERCQYGESCTITKEEIWQMQDNIEIFLLRKFEEGGHVARDHNEKK